MSSGEQRFRALPAEAYDDLVRFVRRRVPADDAEDIVARVFMTVWRRFGEVPADARPWIFAVARNVMAIVHTATGSRTYRTGDLEFR